MYSTSVYTVQCTVSVLKKETNLVFFYPGFPFIGMDEFCPQPFPPHLARTVEPTAALSTAAAPVGPRTLPPPIAVNMTDWAAAVDAAVAAAAMAVAAADWAVWAAPVPSSPLVQLSLCWRPAPWPFTSSTRL